MGLLDLPSTAADSLGTDLTTKPGASDGGESWRLRASLLNKIRGYLIDLASEVGLHDGSTPGSILARLAGLEGGSTRTTANKVRETSGPADLAVGAVADGQVLKRSGSAIVGAGPGPYELLWKWNGVDLSEFDQVGDGSHTYSVTTWGARNSNDDPTPAIRMDSPATSGGFSALLIKSALLPTITDGTRLLIVARMQNVTAVGTQDPLLIPYFESATYLTALMRKNGTGGASQYAWTIREGSTTYADKTSLALPSGLTTNVDGAMFSAEFILSPASASQKPWIAAQQNRLNPQASCQAILQARSAYAAGWTGLGSYAPRIGFGVRTYGTAAASGNCVAELAVYRVTR